jgi:hypothetical protein
VIEADAMAADSPSLGLAEFLASLDRRFDDLGTDGVRAALRAAALGLPGSQRPAFLAMFEARPTEPVDRLLADIESWIAEQPETDASLDWGRRGRYRRDFWDDDDGPMVSAEADELYRRLGERFVHGEWTTAAAGYRRLLYASIEDVDSPDGVVTGGSAEVVSEAMARFVRCLLGDVSLPVLDRVALVVEVIDDLASGLGMPSLGDVLGSHPEPLADHDAVLGALGAAVEDRARREPSWSYWRFHDLALDVAVTLGGPGGLARLARDATMPHRDRAWERWMTELAAADRVAESIEAGDEALRSLEPSRDRARIADQHASLQRRVGEHRGALASGLVALRDDPTLLRLRWVLDDADTAATPVDLDDLAGHIGDPSVGMALRFLSGRPDVVDHLVGERPGATLELGAAAAAGLMLTSTATAGAHTRLCEALIATLDTGRAAWDAGLRRRPHFAGGDPDPEPKPLAPRIAAALRQVPPDPERLTVAAERVEVLAADVLSNKSRSHYGLVARLVVALASTSAAADQATASSVIEHYDRTYRRFAAFRKELQQAAKAVRGG